MWCENLLFHLEDGGTLLAELQQDPIEFHRLNKTTYPHKKSRECPHSETHKPSVPHSCTCDNKDSKNNACKSELSCSTDSAVQTSTDSEPCNHDVLKSPDSESTKKPDILITNSSATGQCVGETKDISKRSHGEADLSQSPESSPEK